MGNGKRVLYFDFLNICACVSVIALHCNQMVHTWAPGRNWIAALVIEVLFYWAVPVFFMLTGATLMRYRKRYDTKTFLVKRFKRTVVPFLAWSILLYLASNMYRQNPMGPRSLIDAVFNNQIEQVYWFFFPLFSIYLSLPALSLLADNKKVLTYMAGTSFLLASVAPYLFSALGLTWPRTISIPVCGGMLIYVILGHLLSEHDLTRKERVTIYCLGAAGLVFRFAYTLASSTVIGDVDRTYFDYSAFPAVLQGVAVFVLFKQIDASSLTTKLSGWSKQLSVLSSCSFGVYLIHKPILDHLVIGIMGVPVTSITLRTVGVIAVYALCVAIVLIMKKIPVLRNIVP